MFNFHLYFSLWIYIWFILYHYKYTDFNPLFALIIAFVIGYVLFIIPMLKNNVSISYLFYFTIIALIIKIIPIYLIKNDEVKANDILFTFTLFAIYLLYMKYLYNLSFYNYYNKLLNKLIDEDKKNTHFFCLINKD